MNIGIIVYSQTGNTLSVAQRLKEAAQAKGHTAVVEQIKTEGELEAGKPVKITAAPDAAKYDAIILASPVMAFSLNPVMKAYIEQLTSLAGKKAGCFVTQGLPANWMGGNQAVKYMSAALNKAGAKVCGTGIVHWKDETKREAQAALAVETLCGVL